MAGNMQGDRSKATIIRTALDLWREGGEKAVTARGIAKRVGLSHAGVIYHFGNTAGMMDAIKREAIESRDAQIISQLILAGDPLVAGWPQADRQAWLAAAAG